MSWRLCGERSLFLRPSSRTACLLLFLAHAGCDSIELITEEIQPTEASMDSSEWSLPVSALELRIGTHVLGEDTPQAIDWWSEEATINRAPIVYGWQGAFMVIMGLQCDGWNDDHARLEILIRDGDWVVASFIHPKLELLTQPGGRSATNLFVVTHGWEEYLETPLELEVVLSNEVSQAQWRGSILFEGPKESIWD